MTRYEGICLTKRPSALSSFSPSAHACAHSPSALSRAHLLALFLPLPLEVRALSDIRSRSRSPLLEHFIPLPSPLFSPFSLFPFLFPFLSSTGTQPKWSVRAGACKLSSTLPPYPSPTHWDRKLFVFPSTVRLVCQEDLRAEGENVLETSP